MIDLLSKMIKIFVIINKGSKKEVGATFLKVRLKSFLILKNAIEHILKEMEQFKPVDGLETSRDARIHKEDWDELELEGKRSIDAANKGINSLEKLINKLEN
jgi:hypothetical protein